MSNDDISSLTSYVVQDKKFFFIKLIILGISSTLTFKNVPFYNFSVLCVFSNPAPGF